MPGVYEIADEEKRTIYVGQSARDVPNRLRQHLARNECIARDGRYWRYSYSRVPRADEARLLAQYQQANGELPRCNRDKPLERDARRRYAERSSGE